MIAAKEKDTEVLSLIETDTIGEILNISMGAAATTLSVLLNKKVEITTPVVTLKKNREFNYKELEPAIGVEIHFVDGINGVNKLIMKKDDVKLVVSCLLGEQHISDSSELDEICTSALGEIMNQMMGSASTALATFFNKSINISAPTFFDPSDQNTSQLADPEEMIVTVSFRFTVEGVLDSQFITILPLDFTKEIVSVAMNFGSSEGITEENIISPEEEKKITGHKQIPEPDIDLLNQLKNSQRQDAPKPRMAEKEYAPPKPVKNDYAAPAPRDQKNYSVQKVQFNSFDSDFVENETPDQTNLDLVMGVELNVSVEIGRTKKQVKDILNIVKGSIIELDRQAGEPVDVIVNGQLIAKGDVVVIDDNFGVRITKVLNNKNI